MKFLVDAQLPRRLADWLNLRGHDAIHTLELPQKNRTADGDLLLLADQEQRVLISKDTDFAISRELGKGPSMLLQATFTMTSCWRSSRGTRPPSANSWRSILFLS